jgi:polyisoprenoid-binding protein YceI
LTRMASASIKPRAFRVLLLLALAATGSLVPAARAQGLTVQIDPAQTKIEFTLGATLHTVHGSFQLKNGDIRFDPSSGSASGAAVIDAASGASGNDGRDRRMHREILESDKFPEIVFTPKRIKGALAAEGASKLEVAGQIRLHGQDHEVTLPIEVVSGGGKMQLTTQIVIPYVQWGLKNPSTFVLRVSDKVTIDIRASGRVTTGAASNEKFIR